MTEERWTNAVDADDRLAYAYLVPDGGGNYSQSMLILDWGQRRARVCGRSNSETGYTPYEWHGHQMALRLPANTDAELLVGWLADNTERLAAIADGYESVWDGSNHVAQFSVAAHELLDELMMEAEQWEEREALALPDGEGIWAASDWLHETRFDHVGPRSTNAEIAAVAADLEKETLAEGIRLEGTEEYLQNVRDELADEANAA